MSSQQEVIGQRRPSAHRQPGMIIGPAEYQVETVVMAVDSEIAISLLIARFVQIEILFRSV